MHPNHTASSVASASGLYCYRVYPPEYLTGIVRDHTCRTARLSTLGRWCYKTRKAGNITEAAREITSDYEIIFVNDGSPDSSLSVALEISRVDPRVRIVDLSRNFGYHQAILAGLRHARGDLAFLIDVDLEEQPEWLIDFWQELHATSVDVVYGVQMARGGSLLKRHAGTLFYKLFNLTSDTQIPENQCTVRLMNRPYLNAITGFVEVNVFLAGLFSWSRFSQRPRYVTKMSRFGKSTYTPARLLKLFLNAITSFSAYPLMLIFFVGTCITLLR